MSLIRRTIQQGNQAFTQQAFADLFHRYKNLVFRTAFLMLDNGSEAEDMVQEVFFEVYASLDSYDPKKGAFSTWLHRITVNHCISHKRKKRVIQEPLDDEPEGLAGEPLEFDIIQNSDAETVRKAIAALSDKLRAVIILRYYLELPYAEISQVLEVPLGTVKSRIVFALRALRQSLSEKEEEMVRTPTKVEIKL